MDTSCTALKSRFDGLRADRQVINAEWDNVTRYVRPYGMRPFLNATNEAAIEQKRRDHYDSTAPVSAIMLASTLHGAITAERWFDLSYLQPKWNEITVAKDFLEVAGDKLHRELEQSGFALEAAKVYLDLATYGTASIFMEESMGQQSQWNGVEFTAVDVKEIYFEEDHRSEPYTFFRLLHWRLSKWVTKFGLGALSPELQRQYAADPTSRRTLLFAVYPREDILERIRRSGKQAKVSAPSKMPWGYKYIDYDAAEMVGPEGGYQDRAMHTPRWGATSESQWGHSPAMVAMGHIKAVNKLAYLELASGEKSLDPPQVVEDRALIGRLMNVAGGMTIVRDINKVKPLQTGIQHYSGTMTIDRYQDAIREYFYIPQIDMKSSPAMTATEVQVRWEQMQRLMAPMVNRIKSDFLDPVVKGLFNMMLRKGALGEMPEGATSADVAVVHHGMLSRSLRNDQTTAMERWVMGMAQLAEVMPEVMDVPNGEEYARILGMTLDVPTRAMNDAKETKKKRVLREKQMEEMRQAELAKQGMGDQPPQEGQTTQ